MTDNAKCLTDIDLPVCGFHDDGNDMKQIDFTCMSSDANVKCIFRNIIPFVCEQICNADVVVGCVAWLTHSDILTELSKTPFGSAVIVQKEDFLRPDGARDYSELRALYDKVKAFPWWSRYFATDTYADNLRKKDAPCFATDDGYLPWDPSGTRIDASPGAIRCVGNRNGDKNPAHPRMHNKFLVFAHVKYLDDNTGVWKRMEKGTKVAYDFTDEGVFRVEPYAVWTGSINLTHTGQNSFENGVLIRNDKIAAAYMQEWGQIMCLSEPLDWQSPWVDPTYAIDTVDDEVYMALHT